MYRLMSLTFFGAYRGPAFARSAAHGGGHDHDAAGAGPAGASHAVAAGAHAGASAPSGASGQGPAVAGGGPDHAAASEGGWHGPHESPKSMTVPLQILAVGAMVAGFAGIPAALGGGNAIERFLEPSFTARAVAGEQATVEAPPHTAARAVTVQAGASHAEAAGAPTGAHAPGGEGGHLPWLAEIGLMALSVFVGVIGILAAYRIYVRAPGIAETLARRWSGAHRVLSNKYYVDEVYGATVVAGTMGSARGLWAFDRAVVDGAVNGSGWLTMISAWVSHLLDKYLVDGLVNLVGAVLEGASFVFRRVQTGLVQNYALVMLAGVFAFVSVYLFMR